LDFAVAELLELWKVISDYVPESIGINIKIAVNNDISGSNDGPPRNLRIVFNESL
jgi:hypothetical protein